MDFEDDTSYTGPPVDDEAIRRAEERLRVTLRQRYVRVLRERNGGGSNAEGDRPELRGVRVRCRRVSSSAGGLGADGSPTGASRSISETDERRFADRHDRPAGRVRIETMVPVRSTS